MYKADFSSGESIKFELLLHGKKEKNYNVEYRLIIGISFKLVLQGTCKFPSSNSVLSYACILGFLSC